MAEVRIATEPRTEFGKGAARRIRRAERVPAVLYGHGRDTRHFTLPGHELMMALKTPNVLLRLGGLDRGETLAIPKQVQRDPIKGFLEHVDLLLVRRGEKVQVDVPLSLVGDIAPRGMLSQQAVQVQIEAEATNIPGQVEVDVTGMDVGDAVHAGELRLPVGTQLAADAETLILHVVAPQTAEEVEAELAEAEADIGVEREPSADEVEAPEPESGQEQRSKSE